MTIIKINIYNIDVIDSVKEVVIMRKALLASGIIALLSLTACGHNDSATTTSSTTSTKQTETTSDISQPTENLKEEKPVKQLKINWEELYPQKEIRDYAKSMIGKKAPDFTLTDLKGNTVKLSDFKGQNVVIEIVDTNCPVCQRTQSVIDSLKKENLRSQILQVFPMQTKEEVKKFLAITKSQETPNILTGDRANQVVKQYGIKFVPTFLFIDKNGFISIVHVGELDKEIFKDYLTLAFS